MKRLLQCALALLPLFLAASLCAQEPNRNTRFGLPSDARVDLAQREDYLIRRPQYTLSYNGTTHRPNWVSWQLVKDDIGHAERGPFSPDPLLPRVFAHVTSHVYDGSGFDRGHQCPAKDRSATQEDCDATFYMTNVVPQSPNSNQRGWERLESYCRTLAMQGHELQIVCGPAGKGGQRKDGHKEEIIGSGSIKVTVPARLWKVITVLPEPGANPRRNTRVIAIIMPNDQSVDFDWAKYRVCARDVEKLTGLKFFRTLDDDLADALRNHLDEVNVPLHRPREGSRGQD
jgi:endonuclease G